MSIKNEIEKNDERLIVVIDDLTRSSNSAANILTNWLYGLAVGGVSLIYTKKTYGLTLSSWCFYLFLGALFCVCLAVFFDYKKANYALKSYIEEREKCFKKSVKGDRLTALLRIKVNIPKYLTFGQFWLRVVGYVFVILGICIGFKNL